jgi:hypothetical protein
MPSQTEAKEATYKVIKAFDAIQRWEYWHEIQLCAQKEYTMSAEEFYRLLPEYQRFIALTAGYEGIGMLSAKVDKLWHAHILNTKRYYDFCQQYLGRIVHHLPCSSYVLYGYGMNDQSVKCIPPSCNVMNSGENVSEIRDTILTAAENFYQAYGECYGIVPSPDVWERLALLPAPEGITI